MRHSKLELGFDDEKVKVADCDDCDDPGAGPVSMVVSGATVSRVVVTVFDATVFAVTETLKDRFAVFAKTPSALVDSTSVNEPLVPGFAFPRLHETVRIPLS